jgi:UDP-N-acetylmuramoylalanine--D-glutamate ligase
VSSKRDLKVVVGLGKTGLSCVRFLKKEGHDLAVIDSRLNPPGLDQLQKEFPNIPISLGQFDEQLLGRASDLIMSPGVSLKEPNIAKQIRDNVPIAGDIELFARKTSKPIVAITGSNGKSTVTSLVGYLAQSCGLKAKVGGNLGTPVLELLDDENTDVYVIELSSFQLETTFSLSSLTAVNLNISADHMDRYDTLNDYIQAKLRIYQRSQFPVINLDDPKSYEGFNFTAKPIGFTLREPSSETFGLRQVNNSSYLSFGNTTLLSTKSLKLKGQHQYANTLAALAMGYVMNLPMDGMLAALQTFQGLPHRCQWVANIEGVDWYNDSKATNIGSAAAAVEGIGPEISGKIVLLAGGLGKNADFTELYAPIKKYVSTLILYGQDKHIIAKALEGAAVTHLVEDLPEAIKTAHSHARKGDSVVLAPACASFDMFKDFEHRGNVFMEIVRGMSN